MELDFSHQAHFIVALAPEIILSVWGMVILLVGVSSRPPDGPESSADLGWLSLLGILVAALANRIAVVFRLWGMLLPIMAGTYSIHVRAGPHRSGNADGVLRHHSPLTLISAIGLT